LPAVSGLKALQTPGDFGHDHKLPTAPEKIDKRAALVVSFVLIHLGLPMFHLE
jgi:hypothetical protein